MRRRELWGGYHLRVPMVWAYVVCACGMCMWYVHVVCACGMCMRPPKRKLGDTCELSAISTYQGPEVGVGAGVRVGVRVRARAR